MAERRFPRPDADFAAYMNHYFEAVKAWWDAQGLDTTDLKRLEEALEDWNKDYPAHVAAQQRAEAARRNKDAARRELEAQARPITNFVQTYPKTTDAERAAIGITVRDSSGTPVATPTTRPQAVVRAGGRLTHTLRLTDESTPTRRARPKGVLGAEVWGTLVAPGQPVPTDPAALSFLTMATKPSVITEYRAADGGKTAVYMLRWVNTRGDKGPWSEVTTATVAA